MSRPDEHSSKRLDPATRTSNSDKQHAEESSTNHRKKSRGDEEEYHKKKEKSSKSSKHSISSKEKHKEEDRHHRHHKRHHETSRHSDRDRDRKHRHKESSRRRRSRSNSSSSSSSSHTDKTSASSRSRSPSRHRDSKKSSSNKRHQDDDKHRRDATSSSSRRRDNVELSNRERDDYTKKSDIKSEADKKSNNIESHKAINSESISQTQSAMSASSTNSAELNINDIMKKIEIPKEIRYNPVEIAKYQAEQLRKKTEELTGIKVPSFYSSTAINPLTYAEQQRKRKLLWSKSKDNENTTTNVVGRAIVEGQDEKTAEKFRKLMGIKSTSDAGAVGTIRSNAAVDKIHQMQKQAFEALDKEYETARVTTHLNRGKGLGFASYSSNFNSSL